ncbi:hypothetical protein M413DRAFT_440927 [Hebeloma cylindrosporum]|uniref:CUE domain-containing protein n=1 Tax=Hebeloma cylindrosporum TaxID=76867 RepID=A0A0C2Y7N2_HEBCY|nr:hypothetical protein M413DRAFT_440927 [Hebeloma cylindrosporum h7]
MKSPLSRLSYVLAFIGEPSRTRQKPANDSDHVLSYYQSPIPNQTRSHARSSSPAKPPITRHARHTRKLSTTSASSSSDYSYDSEATDARDAPSETSGTTRRLGTPSKGGADRRRVAIVQMDSVNNDEYKAPSDAAVSTTTGSIRSRRGHKSNLAGLALVAPPDAALRTYTQLTPPSTAPISADYLNGISTAHQDNKVHHRSASEITTLSPRDVGGLRAAQGPKAIPYEARTKGRRDEDKHNGGVPRLQETRPSRSSSPAHSTKSTRGDNERGPLSLLDSNYPSSNATSMFSPIITPEIGEEKEIHIPVAGPVVVDLDNLKSRKPNTAASWRSESPSQAASASVIGTPSSFTTSTSSAYLRYEPGVHATAGPLPPPPRANINIALSTPPPPRPPRLHSPAPARTKGDIEAVKQALQLPPSIASILASKSPSLLPTKVSQEHQETESLKDSKDDDSELCSMKSIHRREGAFLSNSLDDSVSETPPPPLSLSPTPSVSISTETSLREKGQTIDDASAEALVEVPSVTVVEATPRSNTKLSEKPDHSKFDEWLKENPQLTQPFGEDSGRRAASLENPRRSMSPTSSENNGDAPSPPPKSLRNSLTNNFKRFSTLPLTPSLSSRSGRISSEHSSRSPSPSQHHPPAPLPAAQKSKSTNPAALFCHEVYSQNTTMQRCVIYAAKINELYTHDCGLSEWVVETRSRGQNTHPPRGPSAQSFIPQPRQTSRSSMISEATFPIRPDAYTATDLSKGVYRDITPPGAPPPLPYPSLALNPPRSQSALSNPSVASGTPPSSVRSLVPTASTKGAGFFASLGRKASLSSSRRDRFPPGISSPVSLSAAVKSSPTVLNISHPIINITKPPPTVPGGPRAPPNRVRRSQTFMSTVSHTSPNDRGRNDPIVRRPSLFNLSQETVSEIQSDPDFSQQVDRLHTLLPHADRDILAGYLRRAGQDMLAIGQYMEDERMGTLRRPDF